MDLRPQIEKFSRRFAEVEAALSDPKAFDNPQRAQELSKEYARLKEFVAQGRQYLKAATALAENLALIQTEPADSELAQMARDELAELETAEKRLAQEVRIGLLTHDQADSRTTIVVFSDGDRSHEYDVYLRV